MSEALSERITDAILEHGMRDWGVIARAASLPGEPPLTAAQCRKIFSDEHHVPAPAGPLFAAVPPSSGAAGGGGGGHGHSHGAAGGHRHAHGAPGGHGHAHGAAGAQQKACDGCKTGCNPDFHPMDQPCTKDPCPNPMCKIQREAVANTAAGGGDDEGWVVADHSLKNPPMAKNAHPPQLVCEHDDCDLPLCKVAHNALRMLDSQLTEEVELGPDGLPVPKPAAADAFKPPEGWVLNDGHVRAPERLSSNSHVLTLYSWNWVGSHLLLGAGVTRVVGWEAPISVLLVYVLSAVAPFLYHRLTVSDPGFIPVDPSQRRLGPRVQLPADVCRTCVVKKPPRSKHCAACGRCVLAMDHHCGVIANCVGQGNHVAFFIMLVVHVALAASVVYACWACVRYGAVEAGDESIETLEARWTLGLLWDNVGLLWANPLATVLGLWYAAILANLLHLLGFQLWGISRNTLTNEHLNRHRYTHLHNGNPFDKGVAGNWREFFERGLPSSGGEGGGGSGSGSGSGADANV